ncbi:hypothetical protein BT63DRAFT_406218 [Microthyrium microscopicum]|uniref:Uncharacterized protein n=1 Tax=Microthyrium microscopicum TaxID=703497 RepID=A0A6A6U0G3_9PEZI|nr:hypothetical protein BT63DRAFT_406218 [Microthyrium microscopicum]
MVQFALLLWSAIGSSSLVQGSGIGRYILSGVSNQVPATSFSTEPYACRDIVNSTSYIFNATLAYQCLTSTPFQKDVATTFIKYLNDTLQFQSTLAYLKSPTPAYQQPGIDLIHELGLVQDYINSDRTFENQYAFEATIQRLLYQTHDSHISLISGVLSAFSFGSPYGLVSISEDGKKLPKVYFWADVKASENDNGTWHPSAVTTIDGKDTVEYLTEFAKLNSIGGLEPHADWNQLMSSPALDILGETAVFTGGATFYPADTITFKFENGSTTGPVPWKALFISPGDPGIILDGQDFYDFFVLGLINEDTSSSSSSNDASNATQASPPEDQSNENATEPADATYWGVDAYPDNPDVVQPDLQTTGGGFITGYFLNDSSIGVISIPSFDEYDDAIDTFSDTVGEFLDRSKAAGLKKIVIDLQQNTGGSALLAFDTFKHFFPNIEPLGASRLRAHRMADVLGSTITSYFEELNEGEPDFYRLVADEWVATTRIDVATEKNFTGWRQFYGPNAQYGDSFTTPQRSNLSDSIFAAGSLSGFIPFGYGPNVGNSTTPPYRAEDIVLLTDGACASTCSLFVEMMQQSANVSTIVVGGRPSYGPMQAMGGTRGAAAYSNLDIDYNIRIAGKINATVIPLLPNRTDSGIFIEEASINLRDQLRKDSNIPLQFQYHAANCRIFWTFDTINNFTNLWKRAAKATWQDHTLCVTNSTRYTAFTNETVALFPNQTNPAAQTKPAASTQFTVPEFAIIPGQIPDPVQARVNTKVPRDSSSLALGAACNPVTTTNKVDTCNKGTSCALVSVSCDATTKKPVSQNRCTRNCATGQSTCGSVSVARCSKDHLDPASGIWISVCKPQFQEGSPCAAKPGFTNTKEDSPGNLGG